MAPGEWRAPGDRTTTDQILLGVGLTLSLAVGCQILASRLRIPALIVLLPVGFVAGALTEVHGVFLPADGAGKPGERPLPECDQSVGKIASTRPISSKYSRKTSLPPGAPTVTTENTPT